MGKRKEVHPIGAQYQQWKGKESPLYIQTLQVGVGRLPLYMLLKGIQGLGSINGQKILIPKHGGHRIESRGEESQIKGLSVEPTKWSRRASV